MKNNTLQKNDSMMIFNDKKEKINKRLNVVKKQKKNEKKEKVMKK